MASPFLRLAVRNDPAMMCFNDVVDNGKAEACPGRFGSIIWIEYVCHIIRIDTGTGILYSDKKHLVVHRKILRLLSGAPPVSIASIALR